MNYYLEDSKEKKILRDAYAGDREAQFEFGRMCLWGDYVDQSDEQAAHWTEQAAIQGHTQAMCNYSHHLFHTVLVSKKTVAKPGFGRCLLLSGEIQLDSLIWA